MLRIYTGVVGVALLVLGAGGLLGIWDVTPTEKPLYAEDILYLGTGCIFSYLGFTRTPTSDLRTVVAGMGFLYILAGGSVTLSLSLLGVSSDDLYGFAYHLGQATFGILNVAAAWFLSRDNGSSTL